MFDGYRTTGVVQKLGYVLSVIEFGLFLNSLSSISIAELEVKEALSDKVRGQPLLSPVTYHQCYPVPAIWKLLCMLYGMEVSASGTMDVTHWEQSCSKQRRIFT